MRSGAVRSHRIASRSCRVMKWDWTGLDSTKLSMIRSYRHSSRSSPLGSSRVGSIGSRAMVVEMVVVGVVVAVESDENERPTGRKEGWKDGWKEGMHACGSVEDAELCLS